jgi:hypothetical protein
MVCNLAASFERGREDDAERGDVARSDGAASPVCGDELLLLHVCALLHLYIRKIRPVYILQCSQTLHSIGMLSSPFLYMLGSV